MSPAAPAASAATASVPLSQRAGGPDLARGIALLGIGLANIVGWLHGVEWTVLLKQSETTVIDRVADVAIALFADNRGFPLFALLFGYGIGVLHRRSREAGERPRRFVTRMLKRHVVLAAIGLVHGIFLFTGDILVDYAVIGTLCAVLVTRRSSALILAAVVTLPALALWGWADAVVGLGTQTGYGAAMAESYGAAVTMNMIDAASGIALAVVTDIGLLCPMALGALAARLRLLELIGDHRSTLRVIATWGLLIGLLGAMPLTAVLVADPQLTVVTSATLLGILGVIHQLTGLLGALGIAAAAALIADAVRGPMPHRSRLGAAVVSLEALGAMALTAYVTQSLVFAVLFPPYTADLGVRLGTAGAAGIMILTWLLIMALAVLLRRGGHRGPLETVLRRFGGTRPRREGPRPLCDGTRPLRDGTRRRPDGASPLIARRQGTR
jgi:uncharacterized membrane protein YeiB